MVFRKEEKYELIAGLDVGSSAIRLVAGHVVRPEGAGGTRHHIRIVGAVEIPSEGVQRGIVTSIEEVISALSQTLEQGERMVGVPLDSVWAGINGPFILTQDSKGVVAVAKTNGEISAEDAERAIEAARAVPIPLNYDVLHVLPRSFTVDGQAGIKDPVGMTGMRLEVDTKLVYGMSTHVKNLTRAIYRTGVDIDDVVVSILATGEAVLTPRQKLLGAAVVNIGAATTSVAVYEEGVTLHVAVLPIGSQHITNDIAMGLRTSIDTAERIKIEYGHSVPKEVSKKDIIDLSLLGGGDHDVASRQYVAQIIEARVSEICEKVQQELVKIGRSGLLPAGIIATGGGAKITGFVECAKNVFRLPVSLGFPYDMSAVGGATTDTSFATAIGLLKWGTQIAQGQGSRSGAMLRANALFQKLRKVRQWLIP